MNEGPVLMFCQLHWDALRIRVEQSGLGPLVPESRDALLARMKADPNTPFGGDPLTTCCVVLTNVAIARMVETERLPVGCPVCMLIEYAENPAEDWIKGAVNAWKSELARRTA